MRFLKDKFAAEVEERIRNDAEAHALLALIDAEFVSDPMSVQCFDSRIVERVRQCVAARHKLKDAYAIISPKAEKNPYA